MRYSISVAGKSLSFTLINLNGAANLGTAAMAALDAAGQVLYREAQKAMQAKPHHTQAQLTALGSPYARRHGKILTSRLGFSDSYFVHKQSGKALAATKWRQATIGGVPTFEVYFDLGVAPHLKQVTQGTRVMLPRDPLWSVATLPALQKQMMRAVVRELGKTFRTQAGIRFS